MPFPTITVKTGKGYDDLSTWLAPQLRPVVTEELEVWKLRFPSLQQGLWLISTDERHPLVWWQENEKTGQEVWGRTI